jgi:hypothetical protein
MKKQQLLAVLLAQACLILSCADGGEKAPRAAAAITTPAELSTVDSLPEKAVAEPTRISTGSLPEPTSFIAEPAPITPNGLRILLRSCQPPTQRFTIDPARDTFLHAARGTVVALGARSFVTASGAPVSGAVTLTVREYIDAAAILAEGLTTQSKGALLESGGMVYLEASAGGQPVTLRPGTAATIAFRATAAQDGMQLFRGVEQEGIIDWLPVGDEAPAAPLYVPARYPGGTAALERHFTRYVEMTDGLEFGKNTRYALRLLVDRAGNTSLIGIEPEAPAALRKSVMASLSRLQRWTPASRLGSPASDTCMHYLSFEWSLGVGVDIVDTTEGLSRQTRELTATETMAVNQYYVLRSARLGWINCDRFINDERPRVDFMVQANGTQKQLLQVVFRKQRSVMAGEIVKEGVLFRNVPAGEPVTVMGMCNEGGSVKVAFADAVTGKAPVGGLQYVSMSPGEVKERLERSVSYR